MRFRSRHTIASTLLFATSITLLLSCSNTTPTIPLSNSEATTVTETVDYSAYTELLSNYVDAKGMVDYAGLQQNRQPLDAFIADLGTLSEATYAGWSSDHQMALWINAYNAITLKEIIDHYPIQKGGFIDRALYPANSIRQIDGVWKKHTTSVLGQDITLDAIEHKVLRAQFDEARIHFAIVCASISCPSLRAEAYEGETLEDQLDEQTRIFLADNTKFRIDSQAKKIHLSPIFEWFDTDFTTKYNLDNHITGRSKPLAAVLDFIRVHINESNGKYLSDESFAISYLDYDWSLNEQQ